MSDKNTHETKLKELEAAITQATENEGDIEVRDALLAKANY